MALFVVRVWLPDRPGALGGVASRVGALRSDVVGIEVLERGAGRAIDEILVDLVDASLVDLLVSEIGQVDGVDVEHVRPAGPSVSDRATTSLAAAAELVRAPSVADAHLALCRGAREFFGADWVVLVDTGLSTVVAVDGGVDFPSREWISAFVIGSRSGEGSFAAVDELARAEVPDTGHEIVVSRAEVPLRKAELDVLVGLADIAGARLGQLTD